MYLKKLKAYRMLKGDKQEDVANLIGVKLNTYNFKENGKTHFTLSEAKIIADHYKLTIDELFFDNEVNFKNTNDLA